MVLLIFDDVLKLKTDLARDLFYNSINQMAERFGKN